MILDLSDGAKTIINKDSIKDKDGKPIKQKIGEFSGVEIFKYRAKDGDMTEFIKNENGVDIKGLKYGRFTYITTLTQDLDESKAR